MFSDLLAHTMFRYYINALFSLVAAKTCYFVQISVVAVSVLKSYDKENIESNAGHVCD